MNSYGVSAPPVSIPEKACLLLYVLIVGASIVAAPNQAKSTLASIQFLVNWIPAAHRLLEISNIPGKTSAWLLSSIVSSPLIMCFAISRFRNRESYSWKFNEIKAVLFGLLFMALLITPWLLISAYRNDMKRAGAIISAMSFSTPVLTVAGSAISLMYSVVYASLLVVLIKACGFKNKY